MIRYLILPLALAGCVTKPAARPEPIIQTVEIKVPVVQPCAAADAIGKAPAYPDTAAALAAAPNLFERVKLLVAGRVLRIARETTLTAALDACR